MNRLGAPLVLLSVAVGLVGAPRAAPGADESPTSVRAAPSGGTFRVIKVRRGDSLTLRRQPGASSAWVADIPAEQTGIVGTGRSQRLGGTSWLEVEVAGMRGWVNGRFLEPEVQSGTASAGDRRATMLDEPLRCVSVASPEWTLHLSTKGEAKADALLELPVGVRVLTSQRAAGPHHARYVELGVAIGDPLLLMVLSETSSCQDGQGGRHKYQLFVKRVGGDFVSGCCNPLSRDRGGKRP